MIVADTTTNASSLGEASTEAEAVAILRRRFPGVAIVGACPADVLLASPDASGERQVTAWVPATEPADVLAAIGRVLFGERWKLPLANALGVDEETIRRWLTGRTYLPPDHGALRDAASLLERRAEEISSTAVQLRRWIDSTP